MVNVLGFCAMWLTVLMTTECYLHIFKPEFVSYNVFIYYCIFSKSKLICSEKNLHRCYIIMVTIAIVLPVIYPLNRSVSFQTVCGGLVATILTTNSNFKLFLVVLFYRFNNANFRTWSKYYKFSPFTIITIGIIGMFFFN